MPVYEYDCAECGAAFELFVHRAEDADRAQCPKCRKRPAQRRLSVFSAHATASLPTGAAPRGCGRCGDPNGPCGSN